MIQDQYSLHLYIRDDIIYLLAYQSSQLIKQQQKMNDSNASADESQTIQPISLYQQINAINTDEWRHQEFQFSPKASVHEQFQNSREDTSFNNQLPLKSKISEQILEVQQMFQENNAVNPQSHITSEGSDNKSNIKSNPSSGCQAKVLSQASITIHQMSLASKIYEQIDTQDDSNFSTSLKSFLSLKDKNYRPHVICMKYLYNRLKQYSKKSLQNLKLYINFMEIKMKQEILSLQALDEIQIARIETKKDEDDINMDEKAVLNQIKKESLCRRDKRKYFYHQIKQIYQSMLSTWRKIKQKRQKRQRYIQQEIIQVIDRIELQMQDMIKCRLLNQRQRTDNKFISQMIRSQNPYLTKDKYLEMKYLMQRQNSYLKLITDFNGKIITYMINMFSKEEVQICYSIKQAFIDYSKSYMECYDNYDQILGIKTISLEDSKCQTDIRNQLSELFITFIPKEIYDIREHIDKSKSNDRLQYILGDFSNSLQNTIFLNTIEMNNEFILFRNEATWRTNSSFMQNQQNVIDYESKQALANSVSNNNVKKIDQFKINKDVKLIVVLSSNYYIHLENEDKVATIKLGDVKLSKKGREIIICDKGKGIGGYFGIKRQLGRLQFENLDDVQTFSNKLSLALRKIGSI